MARFLVRRILAGHHRHVAGHGRRLPHLLRRPGPEGRRPRAGRQVGDAAGRGRGVPPAAARPADLGAVLAFPVAAAARQPRATPSTTTSRSTRSSRRRSRSPCRWSSAPPSCGSCIGVLTGVLSAVRARSLADRTFTGLALFFYSMPTFVLGLLFLLCFYYELTIHGIALFPGSGYTSFTHEPVRMVPRADPALVHPRAGVGRHLHPADPGVDAGRDGGGLHPHRPGQRPVRAAGHLPALAARGADAGRHPVRHRRRDPARRRGHHRAGLRACPASASPPCRPSTSRTCRSSSAWSSSPRPRSWWPTSWSTRSTPCSTRGSGCTDLRRRRPGRASGRDHARIAARPRVRPVPAFPFTL